MRYVMRYSLILTVLLAASALFEVGCSAAPTSPVLQADENLQALIKQIVAAPGNDETLIRSAIDELSRAAEGNRSGLVAQLALFLKDSGSTRESMGGALIFSQMNFTDTEKLDGILPFLGQAEPPLYKVLSEFLGSMDRSDGGQADFSIYEARIGRLNQNLPEALIIYMHEISPEAALRSMNRLFGNAEPLPREISIKLDSMKTFLNQLESTGRLSSENRSRAQRSVAELAGSPRWWVRLYAAALVRQHPALASNDSRGQLMADTNPMVRKIIAH
jgi:hypothetical protein